MPRIIKLTDRIQYLQMSNDPLSADVIAVRGDRAWWIFDVGACDEAAQFINALPRIPVEDAVIPVDENAANLAVCGRVARLAKNVVISHFHRDHLLNVQRMCGGEISLDIDALYVGAYTSKTFGEIEDVAKNVVISHFHRDHLLNVQRMCGGEISLDIDALYVGAYTSKTFGEIEGVAKNVVMEPLSFDDGVQIRILPMPNSHAKGSLALVVDDYVFLGDATYPMVGHGAPDVYNVQILGEQIKLLKSLASTRFCLSHKRGLVRDKTSVIQFLESVYARRQKNENYIVA